jgi:histidyl-tRNA synthetase
MPPTDPKILKGFRDYLPEDMVPRQAILERIARAFESFGFAPLYTPALEYAEILLGKYGEEGEKLLYRFRDHGERDVCLRYDLTVPLARVCAMYPDLERPFRRYQIGPVWRGENTGAGRFREFFQCDVDVVGSAAPAADAEVIAAGCAALEALGVREFEVRLNHRRVLDGLLELAGVEPGPRARAALREVDKLPKVGADAVRRSLVEAAGLSDAQAGQVLALLQAPPGRDEALAHLERAFAAVPAGQEGTAALRRLLQLLDAQGLGQRIALDLSIARGLDYYTGAIYETMLAQLPAVGSVMSGGRYDGLIGMFSKDPVPAVGISVGVDRLFYALSELKLVAARRWTAPVLVTVFGDAELPASLALAAELRRAGVGAEVFPDAGKLGRQFKFADKKGVPAVAVLGPDELAAGLVTVKWLRESREEKLPRAQAVETLRAKFGGTAGA